MTTGRRMLATEQACHDIPMQEVTRDRAERDGMGRGRSKGCVGVFSNKSQVEVWAGSYMFGLHGFRVDLTSNPTVLVSRFTH